MMSDKNIRLPELLSPAGSPTALEAAIEAGADAVYFGGARHNARVNAENFNQNDISASVSLAHAHNVKTYFTLNTLVTDRELPELLDEARAAAAAGVDALIMADLGAAAMVHKALPDLPLHASTQASGHNTAAGREFAALGFSRMVCAREMSLDDIRSFVKNSPVEAEVFVHGALCVCHSGQCLFSSIVGGRSGNRGECAQPCRLPYKTGAKSGYPLSLKDLCLARHVPELISSGVASLKIEGRMKSPEYVLAVTRVWRKLLDERRAADDGEMEYLASIFSRGGFTDGYFTKNIGRKMLGVRSEGDKENSRALKPFTGITKKIPLDMSVSILPGVPMMLTASAGGRVVTVAGEVPETAVNAPSGRDFILRSLQKLGETPFSAGKVTLVLGEGLAIPVSKLNALRRDAVAALLAAGSRAPDAAADNINNTFNTYGICKTGSTGSSSNNTEPILPQKKRKNIRTARFVSAFQIPDEAAGYFDIIYLPLGEFVASGCGQANGIILPPVIFDSELPSVEKMLESAAALGVRHALIGNIGHIAIAQKYSFTPHGDFRLNVTNSASAAICESLGFEDVILSPELTLPQIRDIGGDTGVIIYGRIPLMLLEKCAATDTSGCNACRAGKAAIIDRRGVSFPILRSEPHRNIVYNSLPTYMADRRSELIKYRVLSQHFLFLTETAREAAAVIAAYKNGWTSNYKIRRI
jgi:putative protease